MNYFPININTGSEKKLSDVSEWYLDNNPYPNYLSHEAESKKIYYESRLERELKDVKIGHQTDLYIDFMMYIHPEVASNREWAKFNEEMKCIIAELEILGFLELEEDLPYGWKLVPTSSYKQELISKYIKRG